MVNFIFMALAFILISCGVKKPPVPLYSIPDSVLKSSPTPTPSPTPSEN